ncbi:hypothetical protein LOD99_332 [Oopsacas minuta]|uniref:Mitochondrial import inner membrane translocase subunit Tim21 n=1 Tax=Oopsacas minuta TaxID=111878 RepID=A0AAV7KBY8_9METZ|nr:hypothetical protein LOD99_332 [Oopsacas minuta]
MSFISRVYQPIAYGKPYKHTYLCYSTKLQSPLDQENVNEKIRHSSLLKVVERDPKALTPIEKVVRGGKDATYSGVIIVAFGLTAILIWAFFSEFFSSNSLNSLFTRTLKVIREDENVRRVLGEPIRGFGEHTGWNRRRHIDHVPYKVGDSDHMRIEYNVRGQRRMGRVNADLKKDGRGRYQIRYLLIRLEGIPEGTLIVQDSR